MFSRLPARGIPGCKDNDVQMMLKPPQTKEIVKDLHDRVREMRRKRRAATADFVITELELAITFCHIALTTDKQWKLRRNLENATRAHDSAVHFLQKEKPSASRLVTRQIRGKLRQLEDLLAKLQREPTAD